MVKYYIWLFWSKIKTKTNNHWLKRHEVNHCNIHPINLCINGFKMTLISRKRHFKPSEITNNSSSGTVKETQLVFYCLNKLRVVVNGAFLPLKRSKTRRRKWHVEPSWSSEVNQDERRAGVKHHWEKTGWFSQRLSVRGTTSGTLPFAHVFR